MEEKNLWSIVSAIAITALIVGGVTYSAQRSKVKELEKETVDLKNSTNQSSQAEINKLQQKISELENQIAQLQANEFPSDEEENNNQPINDNLKKYSNSGYEISFEYPADFILKDSNNMYPLPDGTTNYLDRFGVDMAFLSLSKSSFPKNTDLSRADILVSINRDVAKSDYFFKAFSKNTGKISDEITLDKTTTINGITYGLAIKNGAAAGTHSQTKIYHTYQNNAWYEIQLNLWTANDGTIKNVNETEIWKTLETILQTIKIGSKNQ
ncbi:MAG: hypothetical protein V1698_01460 [bacterium]